MKLRLRCLGALSLMCFYSGIVQSGTVRADDVTWQRSFTPGTFETAKKENRLVILDLEAVWCHWCHVMDEQTYSRKDISGLIREKYIPIRVDQDARPDLSNRYRDYGWPATIIFNNKGEELEKLAGFVEPDEFKRILEELAANPVPKTKARKISYSEKSSLESALRKELQDRAVKSADYELGGLKTSHKYLDSDTVEYAIRRAAEGDRQFEDFAKRSLDMNLKLIDPAWGGVYQYSTHGDWDHAHFEKLASKQATDLRLYTLGFALWRDERYHAAMKDIWRYLQGFLADSSGAFYVSQDADLVKGEHSGEYFELSDADRRKKGVPAVDKHLYANENGRIATALAEAYAATGEREYLEAAVKAADWVRKHRARPEGGFRHDETDSAGPYLGDTLYAGEAFLTLYAVTGDRSWLADAQSAADFITTTFRDTKGMPGYLTAKAGSGVLAITPLLAENISAVRFFALLSHYTGKEGFKKAAEYGMRYVATREVATETVTEPGVILADEELNTPPLHIVAVGAKSDSASQALFAEALKYPRAYKRTEWWDRAEGPMPNPDVQYPQLPKAAAFVCTNKRCSLPIFQPGQLAETVKKLSSVNGM